MDLIRRDAVIDKINERQRKLIYCFGFENDMVKIMDIARNIVLAVPSAQTDLITDIQNGIKATNADDAYSCGMRNGMRWCISLIDGKEPLYENCPSAQQERKKGKWVEKEQFGIEHIQCDQCGHWFLGEHLIRRSFCPNCGADMKGRTDETD